MIIEKQPLWNQRRIYYTTQYRLSQYIPTLLVVSVVAALWRDWLPGVLAEQIYRIH